MLLDLSPDQQFFRETTARFLGEHVPPDVLRRLREDPSGFDPDYWQRGSALGWTSLLVSEAQGGGTISGRGLVDLSVIAYEFGAHAAPGPLGAANVVAAALDADGLHRGGLVSGLLAGTSLATWCLAEGPPHDRLGAITLEIRADGDDVILRGIKRPVESAAQATHLLVTGTTDGGLTQVVVPSDAPGISISPLRTVDLTRRFSSVAFADVRVPGDAVVGQIAKAEADVERQLQHALVIQNAESVGAMQKVFDLTVDWAFDRYSFGRSLASYQALKHRFAFMKAWLETSHALSDEAAEAVWSGAPDAAELVSAASAFIGHYGSELAQDCVQIHGGIGVTFEHDLHLYFRRLTVNRALLGTPAEHRRRVGDIVVRREESP